MQLINLVTHNKNKVMEFKQILEPNIIVRHIDLEYKEIKADTNEKVASDSAKYLAKKLNKSIVVEDSGLFITALNGFPGACSAFVHKRIGLEGIIKLMKGIKSRECFYRSAVAYCEPNDMPIWFLGEEKGSISKRVKGSFGFGHDPIFIPQGSRLTYGEMENCIEIKKFRRTAVDKLRVCLCSKK